MKTNGEIAWLTGLRGLAALLVVVDHYTSWVSPSLDGWWFKTGGIGMTIFFTLSGYVIAMNYSAWPWPERPFFCLARFFSYRFARLYPAFLLFAILILFGGPGQALSDRDATLHLLLWQTWFPVLYSGHEVGSSPFHVSWSISAECGLYLLFALGMMLRPRLALLGVVLVTAATLLAWSFRADLLPAGWDDDMWRLWLFRHSPWGVLFEFAIGVAFYRIFGRVTLGGPLAHPWIVHVGTVSYSLYLFHPFAADLAPRGGLISFVIAIAMAIMLATGIYQLVEVPGRRLIRAAADRVLNVSRQLSSFAAE